MFSFPGKHFLLTHLGRPKLLVDKLNDCLLPRTRSHGSFMLKRSKEWEQKINDYRQRIKLREVVK